MNSPTRSATFRPAESASGGLLGPELISNGNFAGGATDWLLGVGWSVPVNDAQCDGTQIAASKLAQTLILKDGVTYEVTFTIVAITFGTITPVVGGVDGTSRSATGTFTEQIVASIGSDFALDADVIFVGTVDDISVRELLT